MTPEGDEAFRALPQPELGFSRGSADVLVVFIRLGAVTGLGLHLLDGLPWPIERRFNGVATSFAEDKC